MINDKRIGRNALIISNAFSIEKSPLGQILRSQMKYMAKKYNLTIVSSRLGNAEWFEENTYILKTPQLKLIKYSIAVIRRIFPDITFLPDTEFFSWGIFAQMWINKILKTQSFDYIHSYSFSCANHLVALTIKKKTGIPWLAQFYDPWYDNPDRRFKTRFLKKLDLKLERLIAENADVILIYTHQMISKWVERYGSDIANKIVYVPLSIDQNIPYNNINNHRIETKKLTITHIGNFVLKRTSEVFIKAVYNVLNKYPEYLSSIQIIYVGNVTSKEIQLIHSLGLSNIFKLVGRVTEEQCVSYYENADILLAIDAPFEQNIFYPSKVMKYFYYKKPILGITPTGSVLSEELKKSHHTTIDNQNESEIHDYILRALLNYESLLNFDYDYWKQFSVENIVSKYDSIVQNLIKK